MRILALISLSLLSTLGALAQQEQCGSQAGGKVCPGGLCCSKFGFCGTTTAYCTDGCQSNCNTGGGGSPNTPSPTPSGGGGDISSLISKAMFENMLKHRNNANCEGGFYTYEAFIAAAKAFGDFGTTGDDDTKKREIAAFLAQTSHETTGGSSMAADGPYAWGYCFVTERGNPPDYCDGNQQQKQQYPCAAGKKYFGRGPIQLTHHYNYGLAGTDIRSNLLANPDLVATDATISFKTAFWFWMTPQSNKPSSHDVITGRWTPSPADSKAGRVPGYGVITNIINGGIECGKGSTTPPDVRKGQEDRIGFYKHYSDILGVGYGNNLDCYNQKNFNE
ncbi:hypothetical protein RHGRI_030456 [Rhododendron griersonianum]|uniref:Chitin-binding type-1 domain-containing protein n=1 Tax=Rhododendron griersonianum TaxID=479676 RepID=A0AAV6IQ69_9ERIC|nr:hypothetical protein RHGRI_030456 [Rhododendron griersonianum]